MHKEEMEEAKMKGMKGCWELLSEDKKKAVMKGENLGFMSLGFIMENMWLMAQELGVGSQILSVFGGNSVEKDVKKILGISEYLRIAYAVRLGYPISKLSKLLRVRRDIDGFAHHNRFGNKGFI